MDVKKELTFPEIGSFDWDEANRKKSKIKHAVDPLECEQVFYNKPLYFYDEVHSKKEDRYVAYGVTDRSRRLCIIFTMRHSRIRVISARDQNRKERRIYEKTKINTTV